MYRTKVFAISVGLVILYIYLSDNRIFHQYLSYRFYQAPDAEGETIFALRSASWV